MAKVERKGDRLVIVLDFGEVCDLYDSLASNADTDVRAYLIGRIDNEMMEWPDPPPKVLTAEQVQAMFDAMDEARG